MQYFTSQQPKWPKVKISEEQSLPSKKNSEIQNLGSKKIRGPKSRIQAPYGQSLLLPPNPDSKEKIKCLTMNDKLVSSKKNQVKKPVPGISSCTQTTSRDQSTWVSSVITRSWPAFNQQTKAGLKGRLSEVNVGICAQFSYTSRSYTTQRQPSQSHPSIHPTYRTTVLHPSQMAFPLTSLFV